MTSLHNFIKSSTLGRLSSFAGIGYVIKLGSQLESTNAIVGINNLAAYKLYICKHKVTIVMNNVANCTEINAKLTEYQYMTKK